MNYKNEFAFNELMISMDGFGNNCMLDIISVVQLKHGYDADS